MCFPVEKNKKPVAFCRFLGGGRVGRGPILPVHYISPAQSGAPQTFQPSIHPEAADFDSSAPNPLPWTLSADLVCASFEIIRGFVAMLNKCAYRCGELRFSINNPK
jgi:hypothetical protein